MGFCCTLPAEFNPKVRWLCYPSFERPLQPGSNATASSALFFLGHDAFSFQLLQMTFHQFNHQGLDGFPFKGRRSLCASHKIPRHFADDPSARVIGLILGFRHDRSKIAAPSIISNSSQDSPASLLASASSDSSVRPCRTLGPKVALDGCRLSGSGRTSHLTFLRTAGGPR
jgi:hypothetical protein